MVGAITVVGAGAATAGAAWGAGAGCPSLNGLGAIVVGLALLGVNAPTGLTAAVEAVAVGTSRLSILLGIPAGVNETAGLGATSGLAACGMGVLGTRGGALGSTRTGIAAKPSSVAVWGANKYSTSLATLSAVCSITCTSSESAARARDNRFRQRAEQVRALGRPLNSCLHAGQSFVFWLAIRLFLLFESFYVYFLVLSYSGCETLSRRKTVTLTDVACFTYCLF